MADPKFPNLAIEQLASIARKNGKSCDVFYGTLFLPPTVPPSFLHSMYGQAIFSPHYFSHLETEAFAEKVAIEIQAELRVLRESPTLDELFVDVMMGINDAETCLEKCLEEISVNTYDIVGFSVGFDCQKVPSIALAKALKTREPDIKVLWGGSGCDEEMAEALMEVFEEIDAIVQGEAEATFLPMIRHLRGESAIDLKNSLLRMEGKIVKTDQKPLPGVLDFIPLPDYETFIKTRSRTGYGEDMLVLHFESSRGCWWGDKHHCKFCGIKAVSAANYRNKSGNTTLSIIKDLTGLYQPDYLYATDAILDLGYFKTLLPELTFLRKEKGLQLNLFYETKSNLSKKQVEVMSSAGIRGIQPGIEHFSTNVLVLMDKGNSGIRNVELLKWTLTYHMEVVYGIILGTPGERQLDYDLLLELIPKITHLPPPLGANRLSLHRSSPYFWTPDEFAIQNIRPYELQRLIYQTDDDHLLRMLYEFKFDSPTIVYPEFKDKFQELTVLIDAWRQDFYDRHHRLTMLEAGDSIIIKRTRSKPSEVKAWSLVGIQAQIICVCEATTSINTICQKTSLSEEELRPDLDFLIAEGLLLFYEDKYLSMPFPELAYPIQENEKKILAYLS